MLRYFKVGLGIVIFVSSLLIIANLYVLGRYYYQSVHYTRCSKCAKISTESGVNSEGYLTALFEVKKRKFQSKSKYPVSGERHLSSVEIIYKLDDPRQSFMILEDEKNDLLQTILKLVLFVGVLGLALPVLIIKFA